MKHLLTLTALLISSLAMGQNVPGWNPDANGDDLIGASDLQSFLTVYNQPWDYESQTVVSYESLASDTAFRIFPAPYEYLNDTTTYAFLPDSVDLVYKLLEAAEYLIVPTNRQKPFSIVAGAALAFSTTDDLIASPPPLDVLCDNCLTWEAEYTGDEPAGFNVLMLAGLDYWRDIVEEDVYQSPYEFWGGGVDPNELLPPRVHGFVKIDGMWIPTSRW